MGGRPPDEQDLAEALNTLARSTIEAVAKFMGADQGRWRLEFEFVDGQLHRAYKHEGPIAGTSLAGTAA